MSGGSRPPISRRSCCGSRKSSCCLPDVERRVRSPEPYQRLRKRQDRLWKAIAAAALFALAVGAAWLWSRPLPPTEVLSFEIAEDPERVGPFFDGPAGAAISPDGRHIVIAIGAFGITTRLVMRSMNSTEMIPLPGTEGATQPFWSPDSESVGFVVASGEQSRLLRIDRDGRGLTTICEEGRGRGSWGKTGLILFGSPAGIWSVSENGGVPALVTKVSTEQGETGHHWPMFLDDGRRFLYMVRHRSANREKNVIRLGSLDADTTQDILKVNSSVEFSAGHLLYYREGTVFAQPFDMDSARLSGEPRPVIEGVAHNPDNGRAGVSAAADAEAVVYRAARNVSVQNTLEWFTSTGTPAGTLGGNEARNRSHAISPDGARVAVMRDEADGKMDIYVVDTTRNVTSRLISNAGDDMFPVWSPDGNRLYFTSSGRGSLDLTRRSFAAGASDEIVFESPELKVPTSISRDEAVLLFTRSTNTLRAGRDIWALPLSGDKKPYPVVQTRYEEEEAVFSSPTSKLQPRAAICEGREVFTSASSRERNGLAGFHPDIFPGRATGEREQRRGDPDQRTESCSQRQQHHHRQDAAAQDRPTPEQP